MSRTKSYVEKPPTVVGDTRTGSRSTSGVRLLQLAPMAGATHATPVPKRTPTQTRTNMTSEPAAAVIVAHGVSVNQGTLDLVGAGASVTAPGGSRVAGFIHRDGTAVQFVGDGGGVFLSAALANREFGVLMPAARQLLHAGPAATAHPAAAAHTIHRRADSSASVGSTTAVDSALKSSAAQPLPERNRSRLESSFGASLSGVRVHTDAAADRAAASVQAKAFTTGQDVYFRSGQYQPGSKAGDHLLAHEVAHTVQQGSGSGGISRMPEAGDWHISQPNDSHEREAERAADAAIGGNRAVLSSLSGTPVAPTVARRVESSGPAPANSTAPSSSLAASVPAKSSKGPHTAPSAANAGAPPPAAKDAHQESHGAPPAKKKPTSAAEPAAGKKTGEAAHRKSGPDKTEPDKKGKGPHAKGEHAKKGAQEKGEHPGKGKGGPHNPDHGKGEAKAGKGGKSAVGGKAGTGGPAKGKEGAGHAHGASGAGLAAVVAEVSAAGHEQQTHASIGEASAQTVKAADVTPEEAAGKARGEHVEQMAAQAAQAAQKKSPFNRETFKKALHDKITALQADDAKGIKDGDQAQGINNAVKSGVEQEKQSAAGPINQVAQQPPSKGEPKPGEKLPGASAAPAPQVDGSKAVPEPVPEERRSMAAESQAADQQMAAANVTPEQLKKSNEPAFNAAATAHESAKTQAEVLPAKAQNAEAKVLDNSRAQAAQTASAGLTEMQGQRNDKLTGSKEQQEAGKAKYEAARKRISEQLGGIYEDTKKAVDARMKTLDIDVNLVFEAGADLAKLKFYAYLTEELLKHYLSGEGIVDTFTGGNSKEVIFQKGRDAYLADMDKVIDAVADVVEKGLNEVVDIIEKGRVQLEAAMKQFGPEDAAVAEEVGAGLRDKFASLEKSVEEKQSAIIDSVAQKYVEAQKDVDSVINVLRDPVGALISVAVDAVMGVIDTILKMKGLLMSALSKAGEAVDLILADPIAFLGHLVDGVKQGVEGFLSNIGTYLQKGLLEWLFGALAEAGIQMPEKFDLSGLLNIALQVLGLTWTNIRKRAVGIVGEDVVKTLETGSEIIIMLATKGVTGIWDYIKEQATTLLQTLKDGVKSFIMESVIIAGAKWLIGLLNPASAFVKACMAIYDIVTFIINKGQQILTFVNAVLDSVLTIAKGNIAPAAKAVEAALARSIPVAIGFLASLLGIGDLGDKIKKVIDTIQAPINKLIDWLIKKAVTLVKAVGNFLGIGKSDKSSEAVGKGSDESKTITFAGETHSITLHMQGDSLIPIMSSAEEGDPVTIAMLTARRLLEQHKVELEPHKDVLQLHENIIRNYVKRIRDKRNPNDSDKADLQLQLDNAVQDFGDAVFELIRGNFGQIVDQASEGAKIIIASRAIGDVVTKARVQSSDGSFGITTERHGFLNYRDGGDDKKEWRVAGKNERYEKSFVVNGDYREVHVGNNVASEGSEPKVSVAPQYSDSCDAGHLVAKSLGGPGDARNIVAINKSVNRGGMGGIEKMIRDEIKNEGRVFYYRVKPIDQIDPRDKTSPPAGIEFYVTRTYPGPEEKVVSEVIPNPVAVKTS